MPPEPIPPIPYNLVAGLFFNGALNLYDEGVLLGVASKLNFIGDRVEAQLVIDEDDNSVGQVVTTKGYDIPTGTSLDSSYFVGEGNWNITTGSSSRITFDSVSSNQGIGLNPDNETLTFTGTASAGYIVSINAVGATTSNICIADHDLFTWFLIPRPDNLPEIRPHVSSTQNCTIDSLQLASSSKVITTKNLGNTMRLIVSISEMGNGSVVSGRADATGTATVTIQQAGLLP